MTRLSFRCHVDPSGQIVLNLPQFVGQEVELELVTSLASATAPSTTPRATSVPETRERRQADRQQRKHLEIFSNLMKSGIIGQRDLYTAAKAITEASAIAADVERVSIWLFDRTGSQIECIDLFEKSAGSHSRGAILRAEEYPNYFAALEADQPIVANNAHEDARTSEFSAGYLAPLNIGAMLDAPIQLAGQTIGVLCHEHVGGSRDFSLEDQSAAAHAAQLVALALEVAERQRADRAVELSHSLLSATLEATEEGILAVGLNRELVGFNTRFLEMWDVPDAIIASTEKGVRLRFLAEQTTDPEGYIKRAEELFFNRTAEGIDIIELKDGRIFERVSKPQWMGTEPIGRVWSYRDITQRRRVEKALAEEREKTERLLQNMLPGAIAERLKQGETTIGDYHPMVTVLFADIVGFTELASRTPASQLVLWLNDLFSRLDLLAEHHGVEKIKTIGDSYMAAAGVPVARGDHADAVAKLGLAMLDCVQEYSSQKGIPIDLRIGIHSGPVVAGVIGIKRLIYDLWGDTVNTASRMESHGVVGQVQVSESSYLHLAHKYDFEERGLQDIKGKGRMRTFLLKSPK